MQGKIGKLMAVLAFAVAGVPTMSAAPWYADPGVRTSVDLGSFVDGADKSDPLYMNLSENELAVYEKTYLGLSLLVQEFGRDYETYFSILSAIASGRTEHSQIKNAVGMDVGAHLAKLEADYSLIRRKVPAFANVASRNSHYEIEDCFFRFWFRFIFKYQNLVELGRFDQLQELVRRDFDAFSGYALERYFHWKFAEGTAYTKMDAWWDRKGENEIDLVCEDEMAGTLDFYEIKRDASRIDLTALKQKTTAFFEKNPTCQDLKIAVRGLSLSDI